PRDDDVDPGIPGHDAAVQRLADSLLDGRDVLARDAALRDLVLEREPRALLARPHVDHGVTELALAAGLADEPPDAMRGLLDRLLVRHLRLALVGVDAELAQQAVDDDLEVELAHAFD